MLLCCLCAPPLAKWQVRGHWCEQTTGHLSSCSGPVARCVRGEAPVVEVAWRKGVQGERPPPFPCADF